jgi:transcription elongation factor GreA-like protein
VTLYNSSYTKVSDRVKLIMIYCHILDSDQHLSVQQQQIVNGFVKTITVVEGITVQRIKSILYARESYGCQ